MLKSFQFVKALSPCKVLLKLFLFMFFLLTVVLLVVVVARGNVAVHFQEKDVFLTGSKSEVAILQMLRCSVTLISSFWGGRSLLASSSLLYFRCFTPQITTLHVETDQKLHRPQVPIKTRSPRLSVVASPSRSSPVGRAPQALDPGCLAPCGGDRRATAGAGRVPSGGADGRPSEMGRAPRGAWGTGQRDTQTAPRNGGDMKAHAMKTTAGSANEDSHMKVQQNVDLHGMMWAVSKGRPDF